MFAYYTTLAFRSLRRNLALTALMIAAIGIGIGASMTTVTMFRAMSGDPIPDKSGQLFVPQIDNWGPGRRGGGSTGTDGLPKQLSYIDAINLMNQRAARRQTAMYATTLSLTPPNTKLRSFRVQVRATYTDFFAMFEVPFRYGGAWSANDDATHADVIVITRQLNDKVFGGVNSVGQTLTLDHRSYRVIGVLDPWQPIPRFYDVGDSKYGKTEDVFLPFSHAIDQHMESSGAVICKGDSGDGWEGLLRSECVWTQFWAELSDSADRSRFRSFLEAYAAEQVALGRFHWPPHTQLRDVRQWLQYEHVVSDEARILVMVSFSFLFVCLVNAMGLLLAKIMSRAPDIGVRRALGAKRRDIFFQCLIECGVIGLAGGLLGILLTASGLSGVHYLMSQEIGELTQLRVTDISIAVSLGIVGALVAGAYPTWRAMQVEPAWQLKAQ